MSRNRLFQYAGSDAVELAVLTTLREGWPATLDLLVRRAHAALTEHLAERPAPRFAAQSRLTVAATLCELRRRGVVQYQRTGNFWELLK